MDPNIERVYVGPFDEAVVRGDVLSFSPGDPRLGVRSFTVVQDHAEQSLWIHKVEGLGEQEFHAAERLLLAMAKNPLLSKLDPHKIEEFVAIQEDLWQIAHDGDFDFPEDVPAAVAIFQRLSKVFRS